MNSDELFAVHPDDLLGWIPGNKSILYQEIIKPGSVATVKPSQPSQLRKKSLSASDILVGQTIDMPELSTNHKLISAEVIIHSELINLNIKIVLISNRKKICLTSKGGDIICMI